MTPDLLTIGMSLVVGVLSSYLTFRLQFERFQAMDKEREKHWAEWRKEISADVEFLKKSANITELMLVKQSVDALTKRVEDLWKYATEVKHVYVDPYIRATDLLKQRLDEMEKR